MTEGFYAPGSIARTMDWDGAFSNSPLSMVLAECFGRPGVSIRLPLGYGFGVAVVSHTPPSVSQAHTRG